jgi:hypothetical protein
MPEVYVSDEKAEVPTDPGAGVDNKQVSPGVATQPHPSEQEIRKHIDEVLKRVGEHPRKELGGAFTISPGVRFVQKQNDEEVVLMLRAHPITNLKWILLVIAALLFPEMLIALGGFAAFPLKAVFVGRLAWYLVMLGFSFEKFLSWYYSVFIVTNERVIDIDFVNLLYRVMSYANLNHIEEPAMFTGGFIRSFLKYGDVHVSTAAENPTIEAKGVPHPDKVVRIISELAEDLEKRRELGK